MARLLLLDDDPSCLGFLARLLDREGHEVRTASSSREALEIGASFEPHVLVSDWVLGVGHGGLETARELMALLPRIAIVFVSGLDPDDLSQQVGGLPVRSILQKPIDFAELRRCVA